MYRVRIIIVLALSVIAESSHFRGGTVQWRSAAFSADGMVEFSHRFAWRPLSTSCSDADIGATSLFGSEGSIACRSGCSGRVGSPRFYCTDFDATQDWETGERSQSYFVGTSVTNFEASFSGGAWISLAVGGGSWEIRVKGDLSPRPDNGQINSSPITTFAPLRLQAGCTHAIRIPVADPDQDIVRCRWAQGSQECSSICSALPDATINQDSCIITWTAPSSTGSYAVAIQIEDFVTASSTTPMSSVPLQFTIEVFTNSEPCTGGVRPTLVSGETPSDGACIGVPIGTTYSAGIVAASGGSTVSITRFITASPFGLRTSPVTQSQFLSTHYYSNITWTPTASQSAPLNLFCFRALSSNGLETTQSCITLIAGVPTALSNSASPMGTFTPTDSTIWSITFDQAITRPSSRKYIRFYDSLSGQNIYNFDVTLAAATYPATGSGGRTLTFSFNPSNFDANREYYVLLDSGVAVAVEAFCESQSAAVTSTNFWTFSTVPLSMGLEFAESSITELETTTVQCNVSGGPFDLTLWRNDQMLVQVNGDYLTYTTTQRSYGNYTCSIDGLQASSILQERVCFQLLLNDISTTDCHQFTSDVEDLKEGILATFINLCPSCNGLNLDNIVNTRLNCNPFGEGGYVTATLVYSSADGEITASVLVNMFLTWLLSEDTPAVVVAGTRFALSQQCPTQQNAVTEEACRNTLSALSVNSTIESTSTSSATADSTLPTPALAAVCVIAGLVAGMIILVITVICLIFCMKREKNVSCTNHLPADEDEMTMNQVYKPVAVDTTNMTVNQAYTTVSSPRYHSGTLGQKGMEDSVIYEEPVV